MIALWRYPRSGPPPGSEAALAAARVTLLNAIHARQGTVQAVGSRITRIDGAPTIEFDALETIAGARRQALSTHVFQPTGEVVLEEYAPPRLLRRIRPPGVRPGASLAGAHRPVPMSRPRSGPPG